MKVLLGRFFRKTEVFPDGADDFVYVKENVCYLDSPPDLRWVGQAGTWNLPDG
jgi:hypothetical protein